MLPYDRGRVTKRAPQHGDDRPDRRICGQIARKKVEREVGRRFHFIDVAEGDESGARGERLQRRVIGSRRREQAAIQDDDRRAIRIERGRCRENRDVPELDVVLPAAERSRRDRSADGGKEKRLHWLRTGTGRASMSEPASPEKGAGGFKYAQPVERVASYCS